MSDILPLLVVYKTRFEDTQTFKSLSAWFTMRRQKVTWLIFDNTPLKVLDETINFDEYNTVIVKASGNNEGLCIHYNAGFRYAKHQGIKRVLILDQDTTFKHGLDPYYETITQADYPILVPKIFIGNRLLSPSRLLLGRGFITEDISSGTYSLNKYSPVNSGALISVDLWEKAGGYNESIKLDFSDFSFFARAKKQGLDKFYVMKESVDHELSAYEKDDEKIIHRFDIYLSDIRAYLKEKQFPENLLITFWGVIHYLGVLFRTRFKLQVTNIFFMKFVFKFKN